MNRHELSKLSRDELMALAESRGVPRARFLNRDELVDELLQVTAHHNSDAARLARGFFGLARDLLARVVERGLHLPDAATRIRGSTPPPAPRTVEAPIPTVTLAQIYATQGHTERSIATLRLVLLADAENTEAQKLIEEMTGNAYVPPLSPKLSPEFNTDSVLEEAEPATLANVTVDAATASEAPSLEGLASAQQTSLAHALPAAMLDDAPLPERYDVDECVAMPVDRESMLVYWEVRKESRSYLEQAYGHGELVLRALIVQPTWDGPKIESRDRVVDSEFSDFYLRDLPPDAIVRVAIGYRQAGVFRSLAHSPLFQAQVTLPAPGTQASSESVQTRWTRCLPEAEKPISDRERDTLQMLRAKHRQTTETESTTREPFRGSSWH